MVIEEMMTFPMDEEESFVPPALLLPTYAVPSASPYLLPTDLWLHIASYSGWGLELLTLVGHFRPSLRSVTRISLGPPSSALRPGSSHVESGLRLGPAGAGELGGILRAKTILPSLTTLDLSSCRILDSGLATIMGGLYEGECRTISTLILKSNCLTASSLAQFGWALAEHEDFCPNLRTLDLSSNSIVSSGLEHFRQAVANSSRALQITDLSLAHNPVQDSGVVALVHLFTAGYLPYLSSLNLAGTDLRSRGPVALAKAFEQGRMTNLRVLNLGYNPYLDPKEGLTPLVRAVLSPQAGPFLTSLLLPGINYNHEGLAQVTEAFKRGGKALTCLRLENNTLGAMGAAELSSALSESEGRIRELGLGYNRLQAAGARALARGFSLGSGRAMVEFSAPGNRMGAHGVADLAHALKSGWLPALERLDLRSNEVGSPGASVLFDALECGGCPAFQRLDLTCNSIGNDAFEFFGRLLLSGRVPLISDVLLGYNDCGPRGAVAVAQALEGSRYVGNLTQLVLEENPLEDAGVAAISEALSRRRWPNMQVISLKRTGITDAVVPLLYRALGPRELPGLQVLKCSGNYITSGTTSLLAQACKQYRGLRPRVSLDLQDLPVSGGAAFSLAEAWRKARMEQDAARTPEEGMEKVDEGESMEVEYTY